MTFSLTAAFLEPIVFAFGAEFRSGHLNRCACLQYFPNQAVIPVLHEQNKRLVGYYDTSEVAEAKVYPNLHPIPTFEPSTGQITVLNQMVSQKCKLARVLGSNDQLMGVVLLDRLVGQMIQRS